MNQERLARGIVVGMLAVVVIASVVGALDWDAQPGISLVELHAAKPENGGWSTEIIYTQVGEPLNLHMVSDDVIHGFAVGRMAGSDIELYPGIPTNTTVSFDQPGTYTFYCTRWCGPNHWRMRGTIEVTGEGALATYGVPRYVRFNMEIDAPHPGGYLPNEVPQSRRGEQWATFLPAYVLTPDTYWSHSPSQLWALLRAESGLSSLTDNDIWDSVAWLLARQVKQDMLAQGKAIFDQECAACHGETAKGNGVMVQDLMPFSYTHGQFGHGLMQPPDFSDPVHILGAPPALIEGKILRGGMGTGMPLYGSIYTQEEIEALVHYIYAFVFPGNGNGENDS